MDRIHEIERDVESGKMSREEGERLIEEIRRAMGTPKDRDAEARKKNRLEVQRKIKSAVREGKLSPEDAEKRLLGARKQFPND